MQTLSDISLSKYSTWGIGGQAKYFIEVKDANETIDAIKFAKDKNLKFHILGMGSNTLFDSQGYGGVVIYNLSEQIEVIQPDLIQCSSGVRINKLLQYCIEENLSGLEESAGLPGTIGGAVRGNAGCFGWEIKDNIESVSFYDIEKDETSQISKNECQFAYRTSKFKHDQNLIVLEATLRLNKLESNESIKTKCKEVIQTRSEKQPRSKTCGSVFKNPDKLLDNKPVSSGQLLDGCGLKGYAIGGVRVSTVHANFFENFDLSISTSNDVLKLIKYCQEKVLEKFGIHLEPEIYYLNPDL